MIFYFLSVFEFQVDTEVTEDMVGLADMEATPIMAVDSVVVDTVMGNWFYSFTSYQGEKAYDFYYLRFCRHHHHHIDYYDKK